MFHFINITPQHYIQQPASKVPDSTQTAPSTRLPHADSTVLPSPSTQNLQDTVLNLYEQLHAYYPHMPIEEFLESVQQGCEEIKYLLKGLEAEYSAKIQAPSPTPCIANTIHPPQEITHEEISGLGNENRLSDNLPREELSVEGLTDMQNAKKPFSGPIYLEAPSGVVAQIVEIPISI